jgi:hypothetical protein
MVTTCVSPAAITHTRIAVRQPTLTKRHPEITLPRQMNSLRRPASASRTYGRHAVGPRADP